jgi:hypothetical protein
MFRSLFCLLLCVTNVHGHTKFLDVIIHELMTDPEPVVGLPDAEYIELRNRGSEIQVLRGWKIHDGKTECVIDEEMALAPGELVVLCRQADVLKFRAARVVGLKRWPSLTKATGTLMLFSAEGLLIHSVSYSEEWYRNAAKQRGGWSLEMVDAMSACVGDKNWMASVDLSGGTPGAPNSVEAANADRNAPKPLNAYMIARDSVLIHLDEMVDSSSAATTGAFEFENDAMKVLRASVLYPDFRRILLHVDREPSENEIYMLRMNGVADCAGNTIQQHNTVKLGIASIPEVNDVIINEVLFDPPAGGFDYVELYNRSEKIIDARQLFIEGDAAGTETPVTKDTLLVFPGEYIVVTQNSDWVKRHYGTGEQMLVLQIPNLPGMPDDEGVLAVRHINDELIDSIRFSKDWHHPLISNRSGVALERISPSITGRERSNWASASFTSGYGTPGRQNSNYEVTGSGQSAFAAKRNVVTPDNDGIDDRLLIEYSFAEVGTTANVCIYNLQGRVVRRLLRTAIMERQGTIICEPVDDNNKILETGIYVLFAEVFGTTGKTKRYKQAFTVVR